mgnify:CR=1 FL=1
MNNSNESNDKLYPLYQLTLPQFNNVPFLCCVLKEDIDIHGIPIVYLLTMNALILSISKFEFGLPIIHKYIRQDQLDNILDRSLEFYGDGSDIEVEVR